MSKKLQDHGLSQHDIELFQSNQLSEAMELAWLWKSTPPGEIKLELEETILESLVACYALSMWTETAYSQDSSEDDPALEDE